MAANQGAGPGRGPPLYGGKAGKAGPDARGAAWRRLAPSPPLCPWPAAMFAVGFDATAS